MAPHSATVELSDKEITAAFSDPKWAEAFPPILSVDQAADLLQVEKATIYAWSSQGQLDSCAGRAGKHLRLLRNRFLQVVFNEGIHGKK